MPTERITIVVSDRGTQQTADRVGRIGDRAKTSNTALKTLQNTLVAIGSSLVLRELIRLSDTFIKVENRLKLVTDSSQQLVEVQEELLRVSFETRTSFEATSELYARVALSARNLGVTQREVLGFTQALNQAVQLSGATAQEARNGIIQFAQGLAANRLAGDELRAVLEQLPLVADVIAEELGVTRGSLRDLAAQGKITAREIFDAFDEDTQERLGGLFAQTTLTIGQALTQLQTALIGQTGLVNRSTGVFNRLASAIQFVARNIEEFARGIIAGGFVVAIITATAAVRAFTISLLANPFTALAAAITTTVALLAAFEDRIKLSEDSLVTLGDVAAGVGEEFGRTFLTALQQLDGLLGGILGFRDSVDVTLEDILRFAALTADRFVGFFVGTFFALGRIFQNLPGLVGRGLVLLANTVISGTEGLINQTIRGINELIVETIIGLNSLIDVANRASEALGGGPVASLLDARDFTIDTVNLGRLDEELGVSAERFSEAVIDGFREGFESTNGVQGVLERGLQRARNRADEREIARLRREQQATTLDRTPPGPDAEADDLGTIALRERLEILQREGQISRERLSATSQQAAVLQDLLKIEEALRRKGVELTEAQRGELLAALELNQALAAQGQILDRLQGPAQNASFEIQQLNQLFREGRVSVAEYQAELRRLRIQELEGNQDVFSGFERGLLRVQDTITDFASQSEATIVNAFSSAEDALVQFVQTGKFDISSLVDSILADLTRLVARQALFALVASAGGGGGFAAAGGLSNFLVGNAPFGGARAAGGPVRPGRSFLVGENGPEIFEPTASGNIIPNGQGQQAPVNVQVVNVTDPDEVASAMSQPGVQDKIVNVIQRNRGAVRTALGI